MDVATLLAAWDAPFQSDDAGKGGCPALPIPPHADQLQQHGAGVPALAHRLYE